MLVCVCSSKDEQITVYWCQNGIYKEMLCEKWGVLRQYCINPKDRNKNTFLFFCICKLFLFIAIYPKIFSTSDCFSLSPSSQHSGFIFRNQIPTLLFTLFFFFDAYSIVTALFCTHVKRKHMVM